MQGLGEADTRTKLIDPGLHARGWTEDLIRREETAGAGSSGGIAGLKSPLGPINGTRTPPTRSRAEDGPRDRGFAEAAAQLG